MGYFSANTWKSNEFQGDYWGGVSVPVDPGCYWGENEFSGNYWATGYWCGVGVVPPVPVTSSASYGGGGGGGLISWRSPFCTTWGVFGDTKSIRDECDVYGEYQQSEPDPEPAPYDEDLDRLGDFYKWKSRQKNESRGVHVARAYAHPRRMAARPASEMVPRRPISPWVILLVLAAGVAIGYAISKRRKGRKGLKRSGRIYASSKNKKRKRR